MRKSYMGALGRFGGDRRGSPAVEFAFIAPLLFASVFGVFEFGRAFYEQSRIASAAAVAARTLVLDDTATESAIEADILARLSTYDPSDLTITFTDETIAGQNFKRIIISYDHSLLVKMSRYLDSVTLTSTRYAPVT